MMHNLVWKNVKPLIVGAGRLAFAAKQAETKMSILTARIASFDQR